MKECVETLELDQNNQAKYNALQSYLWMSWSFVSVAYIRVLKFWRFVLIQQNAQGNQVREIKGYEFYNLVQRLHIIHKTKPIPLTKLIYPNKGNNSKDSNSFFDKIFGNNFLT